MKCKAICLAAASVVMGMSSIAMSQSPYSILDLGSLGGGYSSATSISNTGYVAGTSSIPVSVTNPYGLEYAFQYRDGVMTSLGGAGGFSTTWASGVNNLGQVVGSGFYSGGPTNFVRRGFFHNGSTMTQIGSLNNIFSRPSEAMAVNDSGLVVGNGLLSSGREAVFWRSGFTTPIGIGKLGTATQFGKNWSSSATSVNNNTSNVIVVGSSEYEVANSNTRAFAWQYNTMRDLGTFRGSGSAAVDVNNFSKIVGTVTYSPARGAGGSDDFPVSNRIAPQATTQTETIKSSTFSGTGSSLQSGTPSPVYGIDVSHHQGAINWEKVWNGGTAFNFIKATERSSFVSNTFKNFAEKATQFGIPTGAYHFAQPSGTPGTATMLDDAASEATHFFNTIYPVHQKGHLQIRPVLDLEVKPEGWSWTNMSDWTQAFMTTLETKFVEANNPGVRPILYATSEYARNLAPSLTDYDLWIANWTYDPQNTTPDTGNWDNHLVWQYSDKTAVNGIAGPVDGNRLADGASVTDLLMPNVSAPQGPRVFVKDLQTGDTTYFGFGDTSIEPTAINNRGDVVGYRQDAETGETRAFLKRGNTTIDLTTAMASSGWKLTEARDINDSGVIVGTGINPDGETRGFVLTPGDLPNTITSIQVVREPPPPPSTIVPSSSDQLKVLGDGNFDTTRPTVVLSHGWNSDVDDVDNDKRWPSDMARWIGMERLGVNLVAWDWSEDADTGAMFSAAGSATPKQGRRLGRNLIEMMGEDYDQAIHFIGHSFGSLVNRNAVDLIHRNGFNPEKTHVTILDSADYAILGRYAWTNPIPQEAGRIDNYISAFGEYHQGATNVFLSQNLPASVFAGVSDMEKYHSYPIDWYTKTISDAQSLENLSANLGHAWSIHRDPLKPFPVTDFIQTRDEDDDEYALDAASKSQVESEITRRNRIYILESVPLTTSLVFNAVQVVGGVAIEGVGDAWRFVFDENSPAYAWIPIDLPAAANHLSVDFSFHNLSDGDSFMLAADGHVLFYMDSLSVLDNTMVSTGLLDISAWQYGSMELFIGLMSDDLTGGRIVVENIQFHTLSISNVPDPAALSILPLTFAALLRRRRTCKQTPTSVAA